MSELRSKCCGAEVIPHPQEYICSNCGLSCLPIEVEEKEELECATCGRKIERDSLKSRVKVTAGKTSYTPETWDICNDCRQLKPIKRRQTMTDKLSEEELVRLLKDSFGSSKLDLQAFQCDFPQEEFNNRMEKLNKAEEQIKALIEGLAHVKGSLKEEEDAPNPICKKCKYWVSMPVGCTLDDECPHNPFIKEANHDR